MKKLISVLSISGLIFALVGCGQKPPDACDADPIQEAPVEVPHTTLDAPPPLAEVVPLDPIAEYRGTINDDPAILNAIIAAQATPLSVTAVNRAVLSGINIFADGNNLSGCVRDAERLAVFLVRKCGFKPEEIRLLRDDQVQRGTIIDAWTWARKAPGVWFCGHSGHGGLWPDDLPGEDPGVSRIICMQRFDWTKDTSISNNDCKTIFAGARNGVVLLDTCYSGNELRGLFRKPRKHKGVTPPPAIQARINAIIAKGGKHRLMRDAMPDIQCLEMCGPNQTSADSQDDQGNPVGAGTFSTLRRLEFEIDFPISTVIKDVDADLAKESYDQIPQVEGGGFGRPFDARVTLSKNIKGVFLTPGNFNGSWTGRSPIGDLMIRDETPAVRSEVYELRCKDGKVCGKVLSQ